MNTNFDSVKELKMKTLADLIGDAVSDNNTTTQKAE